ncbi:MAG: imelysin family protein [Pseudomonadota bacterium]
MASSTYLGRAGKFSLFLSASLLLPLTGLQADGHGDKIAVLENYANIAEAVYGDSLTTAKALNEAIDALVANPSDETLAAARAAWVASRVPYQQSEAYRFGNAIVDDWEGKVNAWPLDEGLIDYVDTGNYGTESDENMFYTANVIANPDLKAGGQAIDASVIDPTLLGETLHEVDGIEANVATGYHAIEFLLWGQDLNGNGPGAGDRPATDYDANNCTGGNCDRRAAYLQATANLLITDLEEMVANWADGGAARQGLLDGDPNAGLAAMLTGMGSLSYGELAGERMKLGLLLHDPEEEHDCFSDNTHWSHFYDQQGIVNVYTGSYTRVDGSVVSGKSLSDLAAAASAGANDALMQQLAATSRAMTVMANRASDTEAYDQMIAAGNAEGNKVVQDVIDALVAQTQGIEGVVQALGLSAIAFEGSDSLDDPNSVLQ